ncbi:phosphotransferase family protein [Comamonas serinivorans]|uniref:Phosphotransferase family protein n=1 Tax=Comamonas serinivorans TaxID=1082851 RepID=A0A1Y0ESJ7_9BURK|nr:phosphotransferase [Comamonas serinivorans]ARU06488.1 phosphotransferase family protein [Comamonas serinivorans]
MTEASSSPGTTHGFDEAALHAWLTAHVPGFAGPMTVSKFPGGQSNPTYSIVTPGQRYVMRAKPGPAAKLLPSAHAVEREYTVMQALQGSGVPVARMLALCSDESVIGRVFFIMEHVEGRVLWDPALPGMTPAERAAHYAEMNRVLAKLHTVPHVERGLADYGKPGNYLERQIARWGKQYQASITQPIPEMDALLQWLPAHIPASGRDGKACVVHGDYRLDNMIFHPTEPRVVAVLDWELSTLGHPLADLSYHCMVWHVDPSTQRGLEGLDLAALGIPSLDDYMAQYCAHSGLSTPEVLRRDWSFYMAYNLFRMAAIAQGIAKRVEAGTASSEQAKAAGASAPSRAKRAWEWAQLAQHA